MSSRSYRVFSLKLDERRIRSRAVTTLSVAWLAVILTSCGASPIHDKSASVKPANQVVSPLTESESGDTQLTRVLHLSAGRGSATWAVQAPDPRRHTVEVRLGSAATADLRVRVRTWYGQTLRLIDWSLTNPACTRRQGRMRCWVILPALEAQKPGRWTFVVEKRSIPEARITLSVMFGRLE